MTKRKLPPLAICYDFDGTLAPGNMQERDFFPQIGKKTNEFWDEVKAESKKHNADNILIYMWMMLKDARAAEVSVKKQDFENFGNALELFAGVEDWFDRINIYGKDSGVKVSHHIISAGLREMISGTKIACHFDNIYASAYCYDQYGVATWPAFAMNYTSKTQFLFRINKGVKDLWDHKKINNYVAPAEREIPFTNMIFIGDGETDVPCFRLVKSQGGHAIAVHKPNTRNASKQSEKLFQQGRVSHTSSADYREGKHLDKVVKAIIDKVAQDKHLQQLAPKPEN